MNANLDAIIMQKLLFLLLPVCGWKNLIAQAEFEGNPQKEHQPRNWQLYVQNKRLEENDMDPCLVDGPLEAWPKKETAHHKAWLRVTYYRPWHDS